MFVTKAEVPACITHAISIPLSITASFLLCGTENLSEGQL
jgi:hypothetical protein